MKTYVLVIVAVIGLCFNSQAADSPVASGYRAKAVVCFQMAPWKIGSEPTAELLNELNAIKANLPKDDASVTVKRLPDTACFEITASAPTAEGAATRTNQIAYSLLKAINVPDKTIPLLLIMNKAWPAEAVASSGK